MKNLAIALCIAIIPAAPIFGQGPTWTTSTIQAYQGYDYELWNQNNAGTVSMKLTGDNGSGASAVGGTFEATWSNTQNVLFRSGKKWGSGSTQNHTQIGNMSIDFAATWSSTDNVKMLGVYGWAYFTSTNVPKNDENGTSRTYSNQIEYYIIQDRGSYNPASGGTNAKRYGGATIDGIEYDFYVCDRIGQPMLTGNGNFKQFFSVPKNTSAHRTSGKISVSAHFNEWHKLGMNMDGPLYEVAMKVESYTGSGSSNGNAKVTKNLLSIGGALPSSSSGGTTQSSSSGGTTQSSSSAPPTQATTCKTPLATYGSVPADPYTACFKHTNNKCYVCKIENEGDGNTCGSSWVWNNVQNVDDNLDKGYWYYEVACPSSSSSGQQTSSSSQQASSSSMSLSSSSQDATPIKLLSPISAVEFRVRSLNDGMLQVESYADATIYLYNTKGGMAQKLQVPEGSSIVKLSVPSGIYIVKNAKIKQTQKVMVR